MSPPAGKLIGPPVVIQNGVHYKTNFIVQFLDCWLVRMHLIGDSFGSEVVDENNSFSFIRCQVAKEVLKEEM